MKKKKTTPRSRSALAEKIIAGLSQRHSGTWFTGYYYLVAPTNRIIRRFCAEAEKAKRKAKP